ncbi:MAG: dephospho-CoA kinase [Planctomycetes bacterium]|nr:dephospho-CoA kinase [Planctomycetota bacterium]
MPPPECPDPAATRPFGPQRPLVIGLVGGVASGKSTVSGLFQAHGIHHIDADGHARAVTEDAEVLAEVQAALGQELVADGRLDRDAAARRVFSDPDAKARLEAIVHPRVRQRILAELDRDRAAGRSSLLDVPLLFEAGLWEHCDVIVFVDAPDEVRAARARARGWADDELARRERNQLPLAEKRARSQHVIDNGDALDETRRRVAALLQELEERS